VGLEVQHPSPQCWYSFIRVFTKKICMKFCRYSPTKIEYVTKLVNFSFSAILKVVFICWSLESSSWFHSAGSITIPNTIPIAKNDVPQPGAQQMSRHPTHVWPVQ
jgi:hypothetical protein